MGFNLQSIVPTGQNWKAQKILIYSVQGLGKTTFGATFENTILVKTEDGEGNIQAQTFEDIVTEFQHMEDIITALHGEHDFKTMLLDSLDWLEPIIHQKVISENPLSEKGREITGIEDYGYGKGYGMAMDWWRYLSLSLIHI